MHPYWVPVCRRISSKADKKHQRHCIAKDIVKTCEKKDIKTVVVGDLKNIRKKSNGEGKRTKSSTHRAIGR
nr:hypothetical protein [Candidatus Wukongarchaeota archaeon]